MIVSQARKEANRRNAAKSTGPKTPEGKERSRTNALKHGLCSTTIVPEDARLVEDRAGDWRAALNPQDPFQAWLVDEIALLTLRIERCQGMELQARDRAILGAQLGWDDDRTLEAEMLGAGLAGRPPEVVARLLRSPQGCEWLMTRWAMLARSADENKGWTPEQSRLAFDLLGTPAEFRVGRPGEAIDFDGRLLESAADPAAVARREVAALRDRREVAAVLDEADRALAESDPSIDPSPELRRLRRYEATLSGRLRWCLAQLRDHQATSQAVPGLKPLPAPAPVPKPAPKPAATARSPEPRPIAPPPLPVVLELGKILPPGFEADLPAIGSSRRAKKVAKAEARREARRRKLDRLRT